MKNYSNGLYKAQVELLLDILPYVAKEKCFALKGGTAINMFIWDMPRLSVDIDLTYLPFDSREIAFHNIITALTNIKLDINRSMPQVEATLLNKAGMQDKLICKVAGTQVKVEVNPIMRGYIEPPNVMQLSRLAQQEFSKFSAIQVISRGELFGGKICASLDRQHPRDLFDINHLFKEGGITTEIKQGFIAALLSHNKPIYEMLNPRFIDQKEVFAKQFEGMTKSLFTYECFDDTRKTLIKNIHSVLDKADKLLLLSFKLGEPDWSYTSINNLQNLPAVQWKLANIKRLIKDNSRKHKELVKKLQMVLGL